MCFTAPAAAIFPIFMALLAGSAIDGRAGQVAADTIGVTVFHDPDVHECSRLQSEAALPQDVKRASLEAGECRTFEADDCSWKFEGLELQYPDALDFSSAIDECVVQAFAQSECAGVVVAERGTATQGQCLAIETPGKSVTLVCS